MVLAQIKDIRIQFLNDVADAVLRCESLCLHEYGNGLVLVTDGDLKSVFPCEFDG